MYIFLQKHNCISFVRGYSKTNQMVECAYSDKNQPKQFFYTIFF